MYQLLSTLALGYLFVLTQAQYSKIIDNCVEDQENCVIYPIECLPKNDSIPCMMAAYMENQNGNYMFSIGAVAVDDGYVSIGFSEDARMGDEITIDCIHSKGEVFPMSASNGQRPAHTVEKEDNAALKLVKSGVDGESYYCTFQLDDEIKVENYIAAFKDNSYYLMLVSGPLDDTTALPRKHSLKYTTEEKYQFKSSASSLSLALTSLMFFILAKYL